MQLGMYIVQGRILKHWCLLIHFLLLFPLHKIKIIYFVESEEWNTQNEKGSFTVSRLEIRDTSWNILFKKPRKLERALDPLPQFLLGEEIPSERVPALVVPWGLAWTLALARLDHNNYLIWPFTYNKLEWTSVSETSWTSSPFPPGNVIWFWTGFLTIWFS